MKPVPSSAAPFLWMFGGAAAFSVMSVLTGVAGKECDWQLIAVARTALALFFAMAMTLGGGAKLVFLRPRTLWMRSIAGSVSLVGNFYALTHLHVSDVLTVTNMFPLWVALLSWPLLGERPAGDTWLAAVVGITGVALVQQPHFETGGLALAVCVLSSFTSAIALIGLHKLQGIDSRAIVTHFSGVSLVFSLAAWWCFPATGGPVELSAGVAVLLAGIGISATAGQLMLTKAFALGSPARVSIVNLSQVGFAVVIERLLFGRQFPPLTLLGMALVLLPTAWVLLRRTASPTADHSTTDAEPPNQL